MCVYLCACVCACVCEWCVCVCARVRSVVLWLGGWGGDEEVITFTVSDI